MTKKQKKMLYRIIAALALVLVLKLLPPLPTSVELLLYCIPYLVVGWDVLRKALLGIKNRQPFDECFLMAVATVGAFALGDYVEGCAVIIFYQIGELFQGVAVGKSRRSISALMDIRPDYANIEGEDGKLEQVDPDEVEIGTIIVVQPGERVPIDGVIVEGIDNCPIKFAKCCSPLPGDEIIGFVTRGFGVSIHKRDCANARESMRHPENADRWVRAYWDEAEKENYKATLDIVCMDRANLVSDVALALGDMRVPIYSLTARAAEQGRARMSVTVGITNTEHLNSVVARLKKIKDVVSVTRN